MLYLDHMPDKGAIGEIRSFNRFYTNIVGVIDRHILRSPFSLTEVRIMYEIFHNDGTNARQMLESLAIDEGYLSRTIDRLVNKGLIFKKRSKEDGRVLILSLSSTGRKVFLQLASAAESAIASLIHYLPPKEVIEIVDCMHRIQELLTKGGARA